VIHVFISLIEGIRDAMKETIAILFAIKQSEERVFLLARIGKQV